MPKDSDTSDYDGDTSDDDTDWEEATDSKVLVVSGAGTRSVNGVYKYHCMFDGVRRYSKTGQFKGKLALFTIFRCKVSNNTNQWYISIRPKHGQPGTNSDTDFYFAPAIDNDGDPPSNGWITDATFGKAPTPRLTFLDQPSRGETINVLEPHRRALEGNMCQSPNVMMARTCETKVAILGSKGVGKTTVLNTLLPHILMSKVNTTTGIDLFRIISSPYSATKKRKTASGNETASKVCKIVEVGDIYDAIQERATTTRTVDGSRLTGSIVHGMSTTTAMQHETTPPIKETTVDIHVAMPLWKMHQDTGLVFMEVPSLDHDDDTKSTYRKYVSDIWTTLDCVVVVVDAGNEVLWDEQLDLLEFVKKRCDESKNVPVIVICNKVDDTDDEDMMTYVRDMQAEVEYTFHVNCRTKALKNVLKAIEEKTNCCGKQFPIFLPVSAGKALAYKAAASSMEIFKQLDRGIIDKLGSDEVGSFKWKILSNKRKYEAVFTAVSATRHSMERVEATNCDKLVDLLAYSLGGDRVQSNSLEKQIEMSLRHLRVLGDVTLAQQLHSLQLMYLALNQETTHLRAKFWELYNAAASEAYSRYLDKMDSSPFVGLMDELISYGHFVEKVGWANEESQKIHAKAQELVRRQISTIVELERRWKIEGTEIGRCKCLYVWQGSGWVETQGSAVIATKKASLGGVLYPWHWKRDGSGWRNIYTEERRGGDVNPACVHKDVTWKTLTHHDWVTILSSMLLVSHNRHFHVHFGHEKMLLEVLLQRHSFHANGLTTAKTAAEQNALHNVPILTRGSYVDGTFVPSDPLMYKTVYQIVNPQLLSDPSHWGHLTWKYCTFMDQTNKSDQQDSSGLILG